MNKGFFITGTDTGVGKTWFTLALMEALKNQGHITKGMKPVASGGSYINSKLMNDDARLIMQHCSEPTDYELINPVVFELPVAPQIAAEQLNATVSLEQIMTCYKKLVAQSSYVIVEGIGGWRAPLSDKASMVELVRELALPVIMVVGIKLGCINHALLTAEAIRADGVKLCGWVSNQLEKDLPFEKDIRGILKEKLLCPHIADISFRDGLEPDKISETINLSLLLER